MSSKSYCVFWTSSFKHAVFKWPTRTTLVPNTVRLMLLLFPLSPFLTSFSPTQKGTKDLILFSNVKQSKFCWRFPKVLMKVQPKKRNRPMFVDSSVFLNCKGKQKSNFEQREVQRNEERENSNCLWWPRKSNTMRNTSVERWVTLPKEKRNCDAVFCALSRSSLWAPNAVCLTSVLNMNVYLRQSVWFASSSGICTWCTKQGTLSQPTKPVLVVKSATGCWCANTSRELAGRENGRVETNQASLWQPFCLRVQDSVHYCWPKLFCVMALNCKFMQCCQCYSFGLRKWFASWCLVHRCGVFSLHSLFWMTPPCYLSPTPQMNSFQKVQRKNFGQKVLLATKFVPFKEKTETQLPFSHGISCVDGGRLGFLGSITGSGSSKDNAFLLWWGTSKRSKWRLERNRKTLVFPTTKRQWLSVYNLIPIRTCLDTPQQSWVDKWQKDRSYFGLNGAPNHTKRPGDLQLVHHEVSKGPGHKSFIERNCNFEVGIHHWHKHSEINGLPPSPQCFFSKHCLLTGELFAARVKGGLRTRSESCCRTPGACLDHRMISVLRVDTSCSLAVPGGYVVSPHVSVCCFYRQINRMRICP